MEYFDHMHIMMTKNLRVIEKRFLEEYIMQELQNA